MKKKTNYSSFSNPEEVIPNFDVPVEDAGQVNEPNQGIRGDRGPKGEPGVPIEEVKSSIKKGTVANCQMVNVRVSADANCPITSVIPEGEVVDVTGEVGDYYSVIIDHDIAGYIKKDFLKI